MVGCPLTRRKGYAEVTSVESVVDCTETWRKCTSRPPLLTSPHLISSILWPRGSFGHHRWLHNQFPPFSCSLLPSGTWRTPGLSIPGCCLPTSSSVCLVFFPLSLCLARWFWPDLMNGRHNQTTAACIFTMVRSSCGPIACWILARTSLLVTWSLYEMHSILQ